MLVNDKGKVMTVVNNLDRENTNIGVYNKNGKTGQTWEIVYADKMPADLKKGEMNKDWGFRIEQPFYIVSSMESGRYLDLISNQMVIKTSNGRTSQKWFFNQKTKTIHSWSTKSYSWTMRGKNMIVGGTNSYVNQLFRYDAKKESFYNVENLNVLDVERSKDEEGTKAIVGKSESNKDS